MLECVYQIEVKYCIHALYYCIKNEHGNNSRLYYSLAQIV